MEISIPGILVKQTEEMMSEELTTTSTKGQAASLKGTGQEKMGHNILNLLVFSSVFLAIGLGALMVQYRALEAWQILAQAGSLLISLALVLMCLLYHRRGKPEHTNTLIPLAILFGVMPGALLLEGVTVYNLLNGFVLFALAYLLLKPSNTTYWLSMLVLFFALGIIFSQVDLPRFNIFESSSWQVLYPVFTASLGILLIWQALITIEFKTMQSRLLLILIGLGFIPTLIATSVSTFIGFQRDLEQAENFLQTVSLLKNEQLTAWYSQIQLDVDKLTKDSEFAEQTDIVINYQAIERYRQELLSSLRAAMQNLQIETGRFLDLSVVSLNGEILASTRTDLEGVSIGTQDADGNTVGNKNYFIFGKSETYRTPLVINRETGIPEIQIYQPIVNQNGEISAVLFGNIKTDNIVRTITETAQLGETGEAYLVSIYNRLLTPLKNMPEVIPGAADLISSPAIADTIQNKGSRTLRANNFQNQPVIGTYSWNPDLQTVLVVEQSETEAFQSLRLNVIINAIIGFTTLTITIIIAFVTARNFSEPIKSLSNDASKVWHGELKQTEPIHRSDEIGELSQILSQMTGQLVESTTNLEQTVSERTRVLERRAKYLETTSQISSAITSIYDVDNLLNTVTHLISENFGFYHVGVFIVDSQREYAVLRAANSEGGWKMLAREHKLRIGDQGIVGYVTGVGEPRIQQQVTGEDSIHFRNPDLPLTKSEMALPLKSGNLIIGALDVQSTEEQAFTEEDVYVLQFLADSVAVAIQNTRLVQQLQERLETEKRIFGDMTREAWSSMLSRSSFIPAFRSDGSGTFATNNPLTKTGQQALSQGKTITGSPGEAQDSYPIAVPVQVRGAETIAVIETQKPKSAGPWTKEEITILESVGADLGIALENARLVEETQKKAHRDRIAAELASKIWASSDVENILQTAVRELGSALQVSRGTIKLNIPEEVSPTKNPDGANRS